jgi:hypothetical protein
MNVGPVVDVDVVKSLGGFESLVVITGLGSLSESSQGGLNESSGLLYTTFLLK